MFCFLPVHGIQVLWTQLAKCTRRLACWNAHVVIGTILCFRYAVACCAIRLRTSKVLQTSPCLSMRWHRLSIPSVASRWVEQTNLLPPVFSYHSDIVHNNIGDICSSRNRPTTWMLSRRHIPASYFHSCARPLPLNVWYTIAPLWQQLRCPRGNIS